MTNIFKKMIAAKEEQMSAVLGAYFPALQRVVFPERYFEEMFGYNKEDEIIAFVKKRPESASWTLPDTTLSGLHLAIDNKHLKLTEVLLDTPDCNLLDAGGKSLFQRAITVGDVEIFKLLAQKTPSHHALGEYIIEHAKDPIPFLDYMRISKMDIGNRGMIAAACKNDVKLMQYLKNQDFAVDELDNSQNSALMNCIGCKELPTQAIKWLLDNGASVFHDNKNGEDAMTLLEKRRHDRYSKNVNEEVTAIFNEAAEHQRKDAAKTFIQSGIDTKVEGMEQIKTTKRRRNQ